MVINRTKTGIVLGLMVIIILLVIGLFQEHYLFSRPISVNIAFLTAAIITYICLVETAARVGTLLLFFVIGFGIGIENYRTTTVTFFLSLVLASSFAYQLLRKLGRDPTRGDQRTP